MRPNKLNIPVVGVVDSNCKPDGVDYVIPGNDDAIRAIRLYAGAAADAIIAGQAKRQEMLVGSEDEFVEVEAEEPAKIKVVSKKKAGAEGATETVSEAKPAPKKPARATPKAKPAKKPAADETAGE